MTVYPRIFLSHRRRTRVTLFQRIKNRIQAERAALDRIFDRLG